jgi:CubicO group peptidase (beta-lactamase class C family)
MQADRSLPVRGLDRRPLFKGVAASTLLMTPGMAAAQTPPPSATDQIRTASTKGTAMTAKGFSSERLARMRGSMAKHVESGRLPGIVYLVARGDEVHAEAIGNMAFDGGKPMARDTIFRIASITKPIAAAAAMILVEECRLRLDDPLDEFLPELANRQVLKSIDGPMTETVPANRPITLRDLLTFRLGLGALMVWPPRYPIQEAMQNAGFAPGPSMPSFPPDELMKRYGSVPLLFQPGEKWLYHTGSDILGILISRVAGKSFGAFLKERIFDPLGMTDTAFRVPADKVHRLPVAYWTDFSTGKLAVFDPAEGGRFANEPVYESGASGLCGTVDDYLAFSRMMLNQGVAPSGERILSRASVELMTTDQLTPEQKADPNATAILGEGRGWGFGVAIDLVRDNLGSVPGRFGWDGGYGTSAYTDPANGVIGIMMCQRVVDSPSAPPHYQDFWTSTYQALAD